MSAMERQVLKAPDAVARRAARLAAEREQRWMLRQPRAVRRSFAAEVHGRPDEALREQIWMLRQDEATRESYIREVLEPQLREGR
jgi:hypothetical protein